MAGFNPRTSGAFRRVGWAPWLSEDRELPYLYENTSTNRVAVFRENMYDSMGRRSHWCVWDGDNRSRLAAVRADKRARRVDFFAGIQTSLIAEAATVDGVENRGFVLEKVSTLETEIFGRRRRRPHCCRRARRLGSYCSCPFAGSRAPGACCHSGDQLPWAACRPCRPCRPSFSASRVASSAGSKRQSVRLPMRSRRCELKNSASYSYCNKLGSLVSYLRR